METEEALLVTDGASVDDVRHTVDGDLLENFTRLSRTIEAAETESQLALRVGERILGERVSTPGAPRDFLPRFSSGRSSTAPQAPDLLFVLLALIARHLADSMCRKLVSLKRRAAHWTLLRLRALNFFFTTSWTVPGGRPTVTAVNQAQAEAVELGMTDRIFPLEGCGTPIAWVDLERQLRNMIISYSSEAVQRGRGR